MIARDEVRPELCANLAEWRYGMPQVFDRPIDEVARDRDDVRLERVDLADDILDEIGTDGQSNVHVGELNEAQPAKSFGQLVEAYRHTLHFDRPNRRPNTPARQREPKRAGTSCEELREKLPAPAIDRGEAGVLDPTPARELAAPKQHEQQEHRPHPDVPDPGDRDREVPGQGAPGHHRRGDRQREQDQRDGRDLTPRRRPHRIANQASPQVVVGAERDAGDDAEEDEDATERHGTLTTIA